ncbi:MAG: hypothetical protein Q7J16_11375 [Candidatus Cloacimonadales bacterium]|nr:hypothetical protein [Candidatus Cloacimonadales bacterium]
MKMSIKQAVLELQKIAAITTFDEFLENVRTKTGTVLTTSRLSNEISKEIEKEDEIVVSVLNQTELLYRSKLAENAKIIVKITEEERQNHKLYIGHRLMPFLNPNVFNSLNLQFEDEQGTHLQLTQDKVTFEVAMQYVMFMNSYLLNDHFHDEIVTLNCLNISNFHPKIKIFEITFLDYANQKFKIQPLSEPEYLQRYFLNRKKDADLWNGVKKIVNKDAQFHSVDHTLLCAYYHFAFENITAPGSPFSLVYNNQRDCEVQTSHNGSFFMSEEKSKHLLEASLKNREFGKAKDMEGILHEMGISFNSDFLYLLMIADLIDDEEIDDDYILDEILEVDYRMQNAQQRQNLEKAYNKLRNKAMANFNQFDLSKMSVNYLERLIEVEEEIIFLIRDFDQKEEMPYEKKMNVLMPLLDADRLISFMISNFVKYKTVDPQEYKNFNKLKSQILALIGQLRKSFEL